MTKYMKSQIFSVAMIALFCLSQAEEISQENIVNTEYDNKVSEQTEHKELECHECLDFTFEVSKFMHNGSHNIQQLNSNFLQYCNGITNTERKQECIDYNNFFLPAAAVMVNNGIKDYQICSYLGDCPMFIVNEDEHFELGDTCDTCQGLVELAGEFVEEKLPEEKVQEYLDSWCDYSHQYETKCQEIVNATTPLVYQYASQHITPEAICKLAHFCE